MPSRRRLLTMLAAVAAPVIGGAAFFIPKRANAYYRGPVSDHFDGERFFNRVGRTPKGLDQVARLYWMETWEKWPASLPSTFPADTPPPRVSGAGARLSYVGHASWLIQSAGLNILIDPHWSARASPVSFAGPTRANPPGIAFDDLPKIDAVIVTHNHYDHMDVPTIARLWTRDKPLVVTPLGNDTIMKAEIPDLKARAVDWHERIDLSPDLSLFVEPTQHWSARGTRDRMHALWASFVIATPAGKIYAVGDSGFEDGSTFRNVATRHPGLRLALLPIGAYEPRWFMSSQQALGHHWGTFQLTTEAHDAPTAALAAALQMHGVTSERFTAMRPGQVVEI